MLHVDAIAYSNKLSRKNPYVKFFIFLALLILAIGLDSIMIHMLIIISAYFLVVFLGGVSAKYYFSLYRTPVAFVLLSLVAIILSISPEKQSFLLAVKWGRFYVGVSQEGIDTTNKIFFRCMASLSSTYFAALTIPLNQGVIVMKKMKFPIVVIEMIVLTYRFITIFINEIHELYNGILMKNGYNGIKNGRKSAGVLMKVLLFRMEESYKYYKIALEIKNADENSIYV
jgi:cobalt/nickel transport system permease protein